VEDSAADGTRSPFRLSRHNHRRTPEVIKAPETLLRYPDEDSFGVVRIISAQTNELEPFRLK
jgi:hypothetical protein